MSWRSAARTSTLLLHAEEGRRDCLPTRPAGMTRAARQAAGGRPGYGFPEIHDPAWPGRLIACNQHAFPGRTPPPYATLQHYFTGCHDACGEFLAEDMNS